MKTSLVRLAVSAAICCTLFSVRPAAADEAVTELCLYHGIRNTTVTWSSVKFYTDSYMLTNTSRLTDELGFMEGYCWDVTGSTLDCSKPGLEAVVEFSYKKSPEVKRTYKVQIPQANILYNQAGLMGEKMCTPIEPGNI